MNIYKRKNDKTPLLIMMAGLLGSGKSTYAESIIVSMEYYSLTPTVSYKVKPIIHSSDKLRKELFGNEATQGDNNILFAELHKRIKSDLIAGKDVIYDATNISKKLRRHFLNEIKNIVCTPICVCMMTSYETCVENNESRDRKVPQDVITRMRLNWQPPHYSEGFEEIKYVFSDTDKYINQYNIHSFFEKADVFDQENKHHTLTLGQHCSNAAIYIQEYYPENYNLLIAAMLHDVGKLDTQTRTNKKGIDDGDCHYYNHHSVGAYNIPFYLRNAKQFTDEDITYISNLIYYHMHPYLQWEQSSKAFEKDKTLLGESLINDILALHDADVYAH